MKLNLTINDLLDKDRFSKEFLSFLCSSLKFNWQKRSTLASLKTHPFLSNEFQPKGLNITIKDLLKISQDWNRKESLPTEY